MKILRLCSAFILTATALFAQTQSLSFPAMISVRPSALEDAKLRLKQGDAVTRTALEELRRKADALLDMRPPSVMDKRMVPVSGDKHDYFSFGPYWWPDPTKPDGLPYIQRDGAMNPDARAGTDREPMGEMGRAAETLGLAYYFTGHEPYAAKAAALIKTWFLDPATRMNPHFNYAQAVPGRSDGRGIGIIDGRYLLGGPEAAVLIRGSASWTKDDDRALREWMTAFYQWLRTSKNGQDEMAELNNHGTWYDVQIAQIALWLGLKEDAREIVQRALHNRLPTQIEPDGRQPHELRRTKSLNYSYLNLEGLFRLAQMGEVVGVNWWNYQTADGRSILQALRYLAEYADPAKKWMKDDLIEADRDRIFPLLSEAARNSNDPVFRELLERHLTPTAARAPWQLFR